MRNGIRVTDRDERALRDCYRATVLSFAQMKSRHFEKVTKQTVNNRLTRLVRSGYLLRHRVGLFVHHGKARWIGSVFQVGRFGLRYLRGTCPEERIRDEPIRLNTLTLYHDLLLTEVMDALRTRSPGQTVVHGKRFVPEGDTEGRLPDAVIVSPSGTPDVAVELELTPKSDRRYVEIVNQYQHQSLYKKVLYVVETESLADRIRTHVTGVRRSPGQAPPHTGRFYFATLTQLLSHPHEASISNGGSHSAVASTSERKGRMNESRNAMA